MSSFLISPGRSGSRSDRFGAVRLAYDQLAPRAGERRVVIFFPGFRSDMTGHKATYLRDRCAQAGFGYIRFDYRGHGASEGVFEDATLSDWLQDCKTVVTGTGLSAAHELTVVGSSMGGYLALLLARAWEEITQSAGRTIPQLNALVLLAPGIDFPHRLILDTLADDRRADYARTGYLQLSHEAEAETESEPMVLKRSFFEDALAHTLLDSGAVIRPPASPPIAWEGRLRILHGLADTVVPLDYAVAALRLTRSPDAVLTVLRGADHRLSQPPELERLWQQVIDVAPPGSRCGV